jgi:hypothetical protein
MGYVGCEGLCGTPATGGQRECRQEVLAPAVKPFGPVFVGPSAGLSRHGVSRSASERLQDDKEA